jgi:hypothetical protein
MAFLKDFVRPTQIVRSVMRSYDKPSYMVFTNSYKHCRTVKCYGVNREMAEVIGHALQAAGVKEFSIKQQETGAFWRPGMVTIVRIPRSEQP